MGKEETMSDHETDGSGSRGTAQVDADEIDKALDGIISRMRAIRYFVENALKRMKSEEE